LEQLDFYFQIFYGFNCLKHKKELLEGKKSKNKKKKKMMRVYILPSPLEVR